MTKIKPNLEGVTLIHIRKSVVERGKHGAKTTAIYSEQRQLDTCIALCETRGWKYEVYSDVERGHHSGTSDKNRPEWANLRKQLPRPDVARVLVETLSRAYRNVRLLLELLDNELAPRKIKLLIATMPDVDFSTPEGRSLLISLANSDEYRARVDGTLMRGAIKNLQAHGRHWGKVPFGLASERVNGYRMLKRSTTGVWVRGSTFREGVANKPPRGTGWEWRGDYEAVLECWKTYIEKDIGAPALADHLNELGYRYRSDERPARRLFIHDSVRAILDSSMVYAGYIMKGGTRAHRGQVVSHAQWKPLADMTLLKQVFARRKERYFQKSNHGRHVHPPQLLQRLLCCKECGKPWYGDPGRKDTHTPTYYHSQVTCASRKRVQSVHAASLDEDVLGMLEKHLSLSNEALARIGHRERIAAKTQQDPKRAMQAQLRQIEAGLRRLHLTDEQVRLQLAEIESNLVPQATVAEIENEIIVSSSDTVKRLRSLAGVIRRQRKTHPYEANRAMRDLFQSIVLRDGEIVDYQFQAWCAPFFGK